MSNQSFLNHSSSHNEQGDALRSSEVQTRESRGFSQNKEASEVESDPVLSIAEDGGVGIDYDTAYRFTSRDFEIPDVKLYNDDVFESIDMTYYYNKCKTILHCIYDRSFKKHKTYHELKNKLHRIDLQKNLTK